MEQGWEEAGRAWTHQWISLPLPSWLCPWPCLCFCKPPRSLPCESLCSWDSPPDEWLMEPAWIQRIRESPASTKWSSEETSLSREALGKGDGDHFRRWRVAARKSLRSLGLPGP